jgi:soluble lytic murein transglycosylase-like protein
MRRLFFPACLCLVTVGATNIGPEALWPIEAIATSTHAKNMTSKTRRKTSRSAKLAATTGAEPVATFAERFTPFTAALQTPPADQSLAAQYAATTPSDEPADPLPPEIVQEVSIPMSPPPGTPPSVRKRVVYRSQREICDTLAKAADSNNLPVPFFIRLLFQESEFDAASVSHAGAQGIAQFMPETAADVDNPFDPLEAIPAAARLLRDFIDRFGNLGLAAAAYNAGPKRVHKWLKKQSGLPAETRGYVKTITGKPAEIWKSAKAGGGNTALPQKAPCKEVSARYAANTTAPAVPLPPAPPRAKPAPAVQTAAQATKKPTAAPVHGKRVASASSRPQHGERTVLQLATLRREKQTQ